MKAVSLATALIVLQAAFAPAMAADDVGLQRLALCQDSWLDWQAKDPAQLQKFVAHLRSDFTPSGNDPFVLPKTDISIAGLHVSQVFPESVGMGVGFSLTVDAPFDKARGVVEKILGKPLQHCETSDNMRACELDIAEKRNFTLMAEDDPKSTQTLIGCFYFYEK